MNYDEDEQFLPCPACRRINSTHIDICPNCGHLLHAKFIRVRGAIAAAIGVLLVGGMGYLMARVGAVIRHSEAPGATTRFTGGPAAAAGVFAILGLVMAFGIVSAVM